jgi:hypothetical protein
MTGFFYFAGVRPDLALCLHRRGEQEIEEAVDGGALRGFGDDDGALFDGGIEIAGDDEV